MPIFRVKSVKIYTGQFFYTDTVCGVCDKYEVWFDLLVAAFKAEYTMGKAPINIIANHAELEILLFQV